ncbi:MAG: hypothetical protein MUC87_10070 [Bacteroidia bacterium]|jgi:hypothetical protein|nr:hypothetical protein [Bacteroidia bacterium]
MSFSEPARPSKILTAAAVASLAGIVVFFTMMFILSLYTRNVRYYNDSEELRLTRSLFLYIAWGILLSFLAFTIFVPIWTNRIASNINRNFPYHTPVNRVWAAWSWLIPFVHFIVPFQELRKCRSILAQHIPLSNLSIGKAFFITLWQIGFILVVLSTLSIIIVNRFYDPELMLLRSVITYVGFLSLWFTSLTAIISVLQFYRLEKLVYLSRTAPAHITE